MQQLAPVKVDVEVRPRVREEVPEVGVARLVRADRLGRVDGVELRRGEARADARRDVGVVDVAEDYEFEVLPQAE